jgi:hypothetical protein
MKKSGDLAIARGRVIGKARIFFKTLGATLLEIFDESAYERFLQHTHAARSSQSYRTFMREREAVSEQKPRCC